MYKGFARNSKTKLTTETVTEIMVIAVDRTN